jgi:hypothetical protein
MFTSREQIMHFNSGNNNKQCIERSILNNVCIKYIVMCGKKTEQNDLLGSMA